MGPNQAAGAALSVMVHVVSSSERITCLRAARDLMDRRFADPLDLSQLAAHAGLWTGPSPGHSRPVSAVDRRLRVGRARRALEKGNRG